MAMFPLPISSYLMIGLAVIAMAGVGYGRYEHNAFEEYKAEEIKNAREKEHQMQDATDQIRKDKDAQIKVIISATGGATGAVSTTNLFRKSASLTTDDFPSLSVTIQSPANAGRPP